MILRVISRDMISVPLFVEKVHKTYMYSVTTNYKVSTHVTAV